VSISKLLLLKWPITKQLIVFGTSTGLVPLKQITSRPGKLTKQSSPVSCTKTVCVVQFKTLLSLSWMKPVTRCDWFLQQSMKGKMSKKPIISFFARATCKFFDKRINREIFDRIMPHLQREHDYGYPFDSREEMRTQTEQLNPEQLLAQIEEHIQNMPTGYGEAFRYILHRDLHERLCKYQSLARRRMRRPCDPRFIATRVPV